MRSWAIGITVLWLCCWTAQTPAQFQPPSEKLLIRTDRAWTWTEGKTNVVQLEGPLTIETDYATLSARRAVVWLTPVPGVVFDQQRAEIALVGEAVVRQGQATREGERLFVTTTIRGAIRITSEQRSAENRSDSELYRDALATRQASVPGGLAGRVAAPGEAPVQRPWMTPPSPAPAPPEPSPTTIPVRPREPVSFRAADVQTVQTPQGNVALVLSGGITLFQTRATGDFVELRAERAVLFTPLQNLRELGEGRDFRSVEEAVTSAYLEGDVRITYTPRRVPLGEQRLSAERVFYDFGTDRAVLTEAVLHTVEPQRRIPIILRADTIRQLALGEYRADDVELSTSAFATPSYSIAADRAYVRREETGDPRLGARTTFAARDATLRAFDVPFFYLPSVSGEVTERGAPLRSIQVGNNNSFGTFVETEWGLFESLGLIPPRDLDVGYTLGYYGDRGPVAGVNADYRGGFISETTRQPWNFEGDFDAFGVYDKGEDHLGRRRLRVEPEDEVRWRVLWEHQHYFPDDWQAQVRAGLVSDETFLEEYFEDEFDEGLPHDLSLYLKRQRQSEAFTLLLQAQPNDVVTTADLLQEQFEVERLPELGFYRVGDSLAGDRLTFFSANTVSYLHFQEGEATLAEQGFRAGTSPGIPSLGTTGVTDDWVGRGDFRQEINFPLTLGKFRVLPYILGRLTPYTDSPEDGSETRALAGAGIRFNTALWKINDAARSRLFDINRTRHIVEPELHLFTSVMNTEREDVFVYDEQVDAVNDITGVQLALRQRWQTKRGGPGRWRSVDVFALNVEANFYANKPDDAFLEPTVFRGLYFYSLPEASIPRDALNADALWRISDTTVLLGDVHYNLDEMTLATTSLGVAVQRDPRLSYFLGTRYIGEINSTIGNFNLLYDLSRKYSLNVAQSFNFSESRNQDSSFGVLRRFDRFVMSFSAYYDATEDTSGVRFGIIPTGLGFGIGSDQLRGAFGGE